MEVLEALFKPFHDELDAGKLYNIASSQSVDDSLKDNILPLEEARAQRHVLKIPKMSFKVKRNEKTTEIRLERDILGKFVYSSY